MKKHLLLSTLFISSILITGQDEDSTTSHIRRFARRSVKGATPFMIPSAGSFVISIVLLSSIKHANDSTWGLPVIGGLAFASAGLGLGALGFASGLTVATGGAAYDFYKYRQASKNIK